MSTLDAGGVGQHRVYAGHDRAVSQQLVVTTAKSVDCVRNKGNSFAVGDMMCRVGPRRIQCRQYH